MIKQLPNGKWRLFSADGKKNLGTYDSRDGAVKREKQVQYFKAMKKVDEIAWGAIEHSEKISKILRRR